MLSLLTCSCAVIHCCMFSLFGLRCKTKSLIYKQRVMPIFRNLENVLRNSSKFIILMQMFTFWPPPLFEIIGLLRNIFPCLFKHPLTGLLSQTQSHLTCFRFAHFVTRGLGRGLRYILASTAHDVVLVTAVGQTCTGGARFGTSRAGSGTS